MVAPDVFVRAVVGKLITVLCRVLVSLMLLGGTFSAEDEVDANPADGDEGEHCDSTDKAVYN